MPAVYVLYLFIALIITLPSFALAKKPAPRIVTVSASEPLVAMFRGHTKNKKCHETDIFVDELSSHRGLVDFFVLCKAINKAGLDVEIKLVGSPGYKRALRMTQHGLADVMGETVWLKEAISANFLASDAVLKVGENMKGIYTLPSHPLQRSTAKNINLDDYRAVTVRNWHYDWRLLSDLTGNISSATSFEGIYRMLAVNHADFTLMSFGADDSLQVETEGVTLVPIEGVKVQLDGSRHFAVSGNSKIGPQLLAAIDKGLQIMRESGELTQLYQASGFFNRQTKDWVIINKVP